MTELEGGEATATVEDTTAQAAVEAAVSSQEQEDAAPEADPVEAEARKQGWRPKEEWSGDPDNWKDAKTYVEHGEVKSRIAKLEKEHQERFDRLERMNKKAMERQEKQLKSEIEALKAQRRDAIKAGDVEAVEGIDAAIEERRNSDPEDAKPDTPEAKQKAWEASNNWFNSDFELRQYAINWSQFNAERNPTISFDDNMKALDAEMRRKFPEQFGAKDTKKPAANGHAAVDGGGMLDGIPVKNGKGPESLPPEARAAGQRFVKQGLFKNLTEYAKDYFDGQ